MFSTCIHCTGSLGGNDVLERFPIGRRLAFDGARGRLWVVCPRCDRWNLTPLEERWEAIEQAEALFRSAARRLSTEQIGLARLREGTELIRIGLPRRPEYAAWRYGDRFGRRRRRHRSSGGLMLAGFGALAAAPAIMGLPLTGAAVAAGLYGSRSVMRSQAVVARLSTDSLGMVKVRRNDLRATMLLHGTDVPLAMRLRHADGENVFEGRDALRIAAKLMPLVNRAGAPPAVVGDAARSLDIAGGPDGFLARLARHAEDATWVARGWLARRAGGLHGLSHRDRLALEMALHEEAEERAVRGELAELERAWQEAEAIASLADDLLIPDSVARALSRLRQT